tara:strand:+ start:3677 stop:4318 length:642 start_codon:yes stop_codon:yes gene_type:complete
MCPQKVVMDGNDSEGRVIQPVEFLHKDFIGVWDGVIPEDFCEFILNFMDTSSFVLTRDYSFVQDKQINLQAFDPGAAEYIYEGITHCLRKYVERYPYLSNFDHHSSLCLLQKTEPKQGYHPFHCEDTTWDGAQRTLAWMVYFNDVEEGGETEWLHQQLKIQPKAGRVVIWPGSFTHLHRGNPPMENKYIATGWFASNQGWFKHEVQTMRRDTN